MKVAYLFLLSLGVAHARPQGLLSDFKSFLGISDKPTATPKTLVPPATASATNTKDLNPTIKSTADTSATTRGLSRTDTTLATITGTSRSSRPTDTNSSTITSAPSTTSTATPSTTLPPTPVTETPAPAATQSSQPSSSSSSVSPGGIAVAVLLTLAILLAIAWLIFRYHPRVRTWWLAREEKKRQQRSYREAIDGPFSRGGSGVRTQGLGTRKSMMASFFAPRTVKLGNGQEIRRKPVNWGSVSTQHKHDPMPAELPGSPAMEKVALTNMAAPMARTGSLMSYQSNSIVGSSMSSPIISQKDLPPLPVAPPLPPMPPEAASKKGNVHGVLGRKSIYELA